MDRLTDLEDAETVAGEPRHRSKNSEMIRSLLLNGLGVALLPALLVGDDLRAGRLLTLFDDRLDAGIVIWAVMPDRKRLTTKVRLLLDQPVTGCGEHPPWDHALDDGLGPLVVDLT